MLRKDVERIVRGGVEMATGIATTFPALVLLMNTVLLALFVVGILLIASRLAFFWMCPFIIRHAATFAFVVNYIMFFLQLFADAVILVIDGVIAIIDVLDGHVSWRHVNPSTQHNSNTHSQHVRIPLWVYRPPTI